MHRGPPLEFLVLVPLAALAACDASVTADELPALEFVDVAASAGLTLRQVSGDPRRWYIPESNGTGAAWLDYDGDGDMDLFIGNGQGLRYLDDGARLEIVRSAHSALYRNDGGLHFTDVSEAAGCARRDWVQAIATGDVDNDGDPDLYLGCLEGDVFLRNDGGRFVDATEESGLSNALWAAGAAFGDANNDGALDLYVANYCLFDCAAPPLGGKRELIEGVEVGWGPEAENKQGLNPGAPDRFYLGDGKGHFREASRECGLALEVPLCSYAAVFCDVDGDGWQDILVANDLQPANLFLNDGHGRFREAGLERGFALDAQGKPTGAMGLACEDFDGDGDFDVLRSNFDMEANCLHRNDGHGQFDDVAASVGLAEPSLDRLGWGGGFFDADCDGDLDILLANGHVYPQAREIGMSGWAMQSQLFEAVRREDGRVGYLDATARSGSGLAAPRSSRGVAFADADDDGDVDVLIVDMDEPPRLLENRSTRRGHWLEVRTRGTRSNRDGLGALVRVRAGERTWVREVRTTQGLYSSHDPRLHFGLGAVESIDSVEVVWPSGRVSRVARPALDRLLVVEEAEESNR